MEEKLYVEETDLGMVYYSKVNSNFAIIPHGAIVKDFENFVNENNLLSEVEVPTHLDIKTVYVCIHISSQCNLRCTYCFKKERTNEELSDVDVKSFIDRIHNLYPNANRYIIDLSGSGEPLLNKPLIKTICDLCKDYSNKYLREFQPRLVTNGTLLSQENIKFLQENGVLFGVSIDGYKKTHDYYRVDKLEKGTLNDFMAGKNINYSTWIMY